MNQNTEIKTEETRSTKSSYRRGAEDGMYFGWILSAVVLSMMLTVRVPLLSLLSLALIAFVPFMTYIYIRRGVDQRGERGRFSEAWMHGISIFFFGALIMGVVMYVYLRFVDPGFMAVNVKQAVVVLRDSGTEESLNTARRLQYMVDHKMLPNAIEWTFGTMWLVIMTGTMLSMILAALAYNNRTKRSLRHGSDKAQADN